MVENDGARPRVNATGPLTRKALPKRLRYEVLRRDNHACRYCGATAPDAKLTVDHVVPVVLGGRDQPDNLVAACVDCNAGKSATPPSAPLIEDVRSDALRWAQAQAVVQDARRNMAALREQGREAFFDSWLMYNREEDGPATWEDSADQFVAAGLTIGDFEDASRSTGRQYRRDPWRYFCGALWRMAAEINEATAALVAEANRAP